jgi:hypothetical protein
LDKTRTFTILAAVSVLSLAGSPAHAQTFRELMEDIGVQKRKTEKMDFSERAPLVLPPSTDPSALPPPEDGSALASVNPNWPTDPDVKAELDELEREKIPERLRRKYKDDQAGEIRKFQRQEREEGRTAAANPRDYDTTLQRNSPVMSPEELKAVKKQQEEAAANGVPMATVEPERKRLTDPPPGYRMPSAEQPYGPGENDRENKKWFKNPFASSNNR